MKVLVLGAGLMGKEAARDLVQSQDVEAVTLADVDLAKAEQTVRQLHSEKLAAVRVDAGDKRQLSALMKGHDVVVNALFYQFNETVAKTAIVAGVHSVDLGGHIGHITDRVLELHEQAQAAGVTIIPTLASHPE
ncbi:Lysine 6-dehydrogenase [Geobacillus sp. BCO2]|nr:Lysine 6-dehydrogenase [Geobacillus sp. BCO2]